MQKISIIAPASTLPDAEEVLSNAIQKLKLYFPNYIITSNDGIFGETTLPFFSASEDIRKESMINALEDKDTRIIWCFRGGSGCTEIMHSLLAAIPSGPKILIGFSDITALHFLFNNHYQFPTIHGPVITSLFNEEKINIMPELIACLRGMDSVFSLNGINNRGQQDFNIYAKISGGNLTVICNLIGTKLHPDFDNKIIFLEDVSEMGYSIYRYLIHMLNANLFQGVKAVLFGEFANCDRYTNIAIEEFCIEKIPQIPCYKMSGIGHGQLNRPLILGSVSKIHSIMGNEDRTNKSSIITVTSPFKHYNI